MVSEAAMVGWLRLKRSANDNCGIESCALRLAPSPNVTMDKLRMRKVWIANSNLSLLINTYCSNPTLTPTTA